MQTLLIAHSNDAFRRQLSDAFLPHCRVLSCGNGREALEILRRENCECLVLDLMLPELDGITLLEMAVAEDIRPVVLALSPLFTPYAFQAAESLDVGYLLRTPCTVQTVVARMLDLKRRLRPVWASREQIRRFLLWLGVSTDYDGFLPLVEVLVLMAEDASQSLTKVLYPEVGKRLGCGSSAVERNIRFAIARAWDAREQARWLRYFPRCTGRPSNKLFFTRVLEALRNGEWE
ncbi:MAG: sporulation initiation factor Spo0A C-terminal domain-containing protein [Faecousia sp.]